MVLRLYSGGVRPSWLGTHPKQSQASLPITRRHGLSNQNRLQSTAGSHPLVYIPICNVYNFGQPNGAPPVFKDVHWTVREGESWAVVGAGGGEKTALLQVSSIRFCINDQK
jgi:ABC-type transport system involved in cytochrome bd biosynthesis fused ATPase/permease subunit